MAEAAKGGRGSPGLPKPPGYRNPQPAAVPQPPQVAVGVKGRPIQRPPTKRRKPRRSCCCRCCVCCAWTAFVVVVLLLLVALAGAVVVAWFQPRAPEFTIERLKVSRFHLKGGSGIMSYLAANVDLSFSILSRNDRVQFSYGAMKVEVATELTSLGHAIAPAFTQGVKNSTIVAVHTKVSGSAVGGSTGSKLRKKFEENALVLDVDVSGEIGPIIGGWQSPAMPLTVTCNGLHQEKLAAGSQPRCSAYLFRVIPFN